MEYPIELSLPLVKSLKTAPINTSGKNMFTRLSLKPKIAMSQPLNVVPMFAPNIIPRA